MMLGNILGMLGGPQNILSSVGNFAAGLADKLGKGDSFGSALGSSASSSIKQLLGQDATKDLPIIASTNARDATATNPVITTNPLSASNMLPQAMTSVRPMLPLIERPAYQMLPSERIEFPAERVQEYSIRGGAPGGMPRTEYAKSFNKYKPRRGKNDYTYEDELYTSRPVKSRASARQNTIRNRAARNMEFRGQPADRGSYRRQGTIRYNKNY